jgi:hypothetical protein
LQWQAVAGVASYRVQMALDAGFTRPTHDFSKVTATSFVPTPSVEPGARFWRVASVDAAGKQGPFSAPSSFRVEAPSLVVTQSVSAGEAEFTWSAPRGQRFQVQFSTTESFRLPISDRIVNEPSAKFDQLPKGVYFFRVRSVDASDKGIGEWSAPQSVEVFSRLFP